MKKIGLILMIIMSLTTIAMADMEEAVNQTIDSTTWTAVALDGSTACSSYIFHSRDGSDFKWKKTASSMEYYTFKDGEALTVNFVRERQPSTLFYAQSVSGSVVIEVLVFNNN